MKKRVRILATPILVLIACAAVTIPSLAQASPSNTTSNDKWVGVWQGQLEGVPGVTLTLGNDVGDVNGTIVFTALREGSVVGHAVHVIMHAHADGNVLSFQVKRPGSDIEIVDISLVLADGARGQLLCPKCGSASPIEMVKLN